MQRDAIGALAGHIQAIGAHAAKALTQVGIKQTGDANVVLGIVNADHGLAGKASAGLAHERAAEASDVDDGIALDAFKDLDLAVLQRDCSEQRATLIGRERPAVDEICRRAVCHAGLQ